MMDVKKLEKLQVKIAKAKEDEIKARGALEPLMKQLKEDFECDTIEEAQTKLTEITKELTSIEDEYEEKILEVEKAIENKDTVDLGGVAYTPKTGHMAYREDK